MESLEDTLAEIWCENEKVKYLLEEMRRYFEDEKPGPYWGECNYHILGNLASVIHDYVFAIDERINKIIL